MKSKPKPPNLSAGWLTNARMPPRDITPVAKSSPPQQTNFSAISEPVRLPPITLTGAATELCDVFIERLGGEFQAFDCGQIREDRLTKRFGSHAHLQGHS